MDLLVAAPASDNVSIYGRHQQRALHKVFLPSFSLPFPRI